MVNEQLHLSGHRVTHGIVPTPLVRRMLLPTELYSTILFRVRLPKVGPFLVYLRGLDITRAYGMYLHLPWRKAHNEEQKRNTGTGREGGFARNPSLQDVNNYDFWAFH